MSDIPFHQTACGRRFVSHTALQIVRQLAILNDLLKRLIESGAGGCVAPGCGAQREGRAGK